MKKFILILALLSAPALLFGQAKPKVSITITSINAKIGDVSTPFKHMAFTVNYTVTNNTSEAVVQAHGVSRWNADNQNVPFDRKLVCAEQLKKIETASAPFPAGKSISDSVAFDENILAGKTEMVVGCVVYRGADGIVHSKSFKHLFVPEIDSTGKPAITRKFTKNGSED